MGLDGASEQSAAAGAHRHPGTRRQQAEASHSPSGWRRPRTQSPCSCRSFHSRWRARPGGWTPGGRRRSAARAVPAAPRACGGGQESHLSRCCPLPAACAPMQMQLPAAAAAAEAHLAPRSPPQKSNMAQAPAGSTSCSSRSSAAKRSATSAVHRACGSWAWWRRWRGGMGGGGAALPSARGSCGGGTARCLPARSVQAAHPTSPGPQGPPNWRTLRASRSRSRRETGGPAAAGARGGRGSGVGGEQAMQRVHGRRRCMAALAAAATHACITRPHLQPLHKGSHHELAHGAVKGSSLLLQVLAAGTREWQGRGCARAEGKQGEARLRWAASTAALTVPHHPPGCARPLRTQVTQGGAGAGGCSRPPSNHGPPCRCQASGRQGHATRGSNTDERNEVHEQDGACLWEGRRAHALGLHHVLFVWTCLRSSVLLPRVAWPCRPEAWHQQVIGWGRGAACNSALKALEAGLWHASPSGSRTPGSHLGSLRRRQPRKRRGTRARAHHAAHVGGRQELRHLLRGGGHQHRHLLRGHGGRHCVGGRGGTGGTGHTARCIAGPATPATSAGAPACTRPGSL